jgi:hypothetical protein
MKTGFRCRWEKEGAHVDMTSPSPVMARALTGAVHFSNSSSCVVSNKAIASAGDDGSKKFGECDVIRDGNELINPV